MIRHDEIETEHFIIDFASRSPYKSYGAEESGGEFRCEEEFWTF